MRSRSLRLTLAGVLAFSLAGPEIALARHKDDVAAGIVGGLLLGAVAVAASSHDHYHRDQYMPAPVYRPRMSPFSPTFGVTCYPREGACYNDDGDFLPTWTRRVF